MTEDSPQQHDSAVIAWRNADTVPLNLAQLRTWALRSMLRAGEPVRQQGNQAPQVSIIGRRAE